MCYSDDNTSLITDGHPSYLIVLIGLHGSGTAVAHLGSRCCMRLTNIYEVSRLCELAYTRYSRHRQGCVEYVLNPSIQRPSPFSRKDGGAVAISLRAPLCESIDYQRFLTDR